MPRLTDVATKTDEEIRKAIASAIEGGAVIDVRFVSAVIADRVGVSSSARSIEIHLAEAAVAARVAVCL